MKPIIQPRGNQAQHGGRMIGFMPDIQAQTVPLIKADNVIVKNLPALAFEQNVRLVREIGQFNPSRRRETVVLRHDDDERRLENNFCLQWPGARRKPEIRNPKYEARIDGAFMERFQLPFGTEAVDVEMHFGKTLAEFPKCISTST